MSNDSNAQSNRAPEPSEAAQTGGEAAPFELELAKARDELLRALAEIENTRRRAERQTQEARLYAIDRFAADLLPVADTLSRALASVSPQAREAADDALRTLLAGIELTERTLLDTFARHGLKRVGGRGDAFDPNLHQAVAQAPSESPPGAIAEVMQPGYVLGDRTLRPAMVLVSTGPSAPASPAPGSVDIKV